MQTIVKYLRIFSYASKPTLTMFHKKYIKFAFPTLIIYRTIVFLNNPIIWDPSHSGHTAPRKNSMKWLRTWKILSLQQKITSFISGKPSLTTFNPHLIYFAIRLALPKSPSRKNINRKKSRTHNLMVEGTIRMW